MKSVVKILAVSVALLSWNGSVLAASDSDEVIDKGRRMSMPSRTVSRPAVQAPRPQVPVRNTVVSSGNQSSGRSGGYLVRGAVRTGQETPTVMRRGTSGQGEYWSPSRNSWQPILGYSDTPRSTSGNATTATSSRASGNRPGTGSTGTVTRSTTPSTPSSGRYDSITSARVSGSSAARVQAGDLEPQQLPYGRGSASSTASTNGSQGFVASMPASLSDAARSGLRRIGVTTTSAARAVGDFANNHYVNSAWNAANAGAPSAGTPIPAWADLTMTALGATRSAVQGNWEDAGLGAFPAAAGHILTQVGPEWAGEALLPISGLSAITHGMQAVTDDAARVSSSLYGRSGGWERRLQERQTQIQMMTDSGDRAERNQNRFPAEMPRSNADAGTPYGYMRPYGEYERETGGRQND